MSPIPFRKLTWEDRKAIPVEFLTMKDGEPPVLAVRNPEKEDDLCILVRLTSEGLLALPGCQGKLHDWGFDTDLSGWTPEGCIEMLYDIAEDSGPAAALPEPGPAAGTAPLKKTKGGKN